MYFFVKTLISAFVIAGVTQLSEKTPVGAALLKSLPLTSFLVFFFMKYEGRTDKEIISMSWDILYLVIPSLVLFISLPLLMSKGMNFYWSMFVSSVIMCGCYAVTLKIMG
jgi:hypothetical protein